MATDIYPAIRREVEALEEARLAYERIEENSWDALLAARAALNRRVERLILGVACGGYIRDGQVYLAESKARALLNEEPDDVSG